MQIFMIHSLSSGYALLYPYSNFRLIANSAEATALLCSSLLLAPHAPSLASAPQWRECCTLQFMNWL